MTTLQVTYQPTSTFETEIDLENVHHWYVKWDTLYVQKSKDDDFIEIEPTYSYNDATEWVKRPTDTMLLSEEVN